MASFAKSKIDLPVAIPAGVTSVYTRGIWGTWYDIAEPARSGEYLDWAHRHYLPFLSAHGDYLWVAHYRYVGGGAQMAQIKADVVTHENGDDVGGGKQFLVLVGAASPHRFFAPAIDELPLPDGFAEMLALRSGTRTIVFSEEARVDGPSAAPAGAGDELPAPAIQMGTLRVRAELDEFDLIKWYAQYRLPAMQKMQGSVRTRKLTGVAGWAKHGILYEFDSIASRLEHFERSHESHALDPQHWTHRITRNSVHAPGSPFIGERVWAWSTRG